MNIVLIGNNTPFGDAVTLTPELALPEHTFITFPEDFCYTKPNWIYSLETSLIEAFGSPDKTDLLIMTCSKEDRTSPQQYTLRALYPLFRKVSMQIMVVNDICHLVESAKTSLYHARKRDVERFVLGQFGDTNRVCNLSIFSTALNKTPSDSVIELFLDFTKSSFGSVSSLRALAIFKE